MGASRKEALWKEVTAVLHALGPAVKTVKLWRKYWSRLCYDSRKLARDIERERRTTEHQGLQRQPLLSPSRCGPPQYHSLLHPCSLQQHRSLPQQPTSLWGASRAPAALHHHRELMEEVRGMHSAQERIATALELLLGALVPGIAVPAPPSQPPSSPRP
ncbi:hypothetical protein MTO96_018363 [Rhipicephalus appendiculatus]